MKEIISTIMCLSFVTGTYEVVVDTYFQNDVWYTGGGYYGKKWAKDSSRSVCVSEGYVRSILSDEQWEQLTKNEIIECEIRIDK